jgi:pyruvate kinase
LIGSGTRSSVGVLIARRDLAVEVGYARSAGVQEEILRLGEAAHLPVVWATEVLDQLARNGRPSRAEVTDAATAQRAECMTLNKFCVVERELVGRPGDAERLSADGRSGQTRPVLKSCHVPTHHRSLEGRRLRHRRRFFDAYGD